MHCGILQGQRINQLKLNVTLKSDECALLLAPPLHRMTSNPTINHSKASCIESPWSSMTRLIVTTVLQQCAINHLVHCRGGQQGSRHNQQGEHRGSVSG